MIGDPTRGNAWTECFLSLPANEIHLCGDASALGLIERLVALTGDTLETQTYERRSPLVVAPRPLSHLSDLTDGDCVVAFSRRDIYELKYQIESVTPHRCCVIYGRLPPEARAAQARLFNEQSGQNVLVASDAIGMGLNLCVAFLLFFGPNNVGRPGESVGSFSPRSANLPDVKCSRSARRRLSRSPDAPDDLARALSRD